MNSSKTVNGFTVLSLIIHHIILSLMETKNNLSKIFVYSNFCPAPGRGMKLQREFPLLVSCENYRKAEQYSIEQILTNFPSHFLSLFYVNSKDKSIKYC